MPKIQSRRSVSVKKHQYEKVSEHCADSGQSISDFMGTLIDDFFKERPRATEEPQAARGMDPALAEAVAEIRDRLAIVEEIVEGRLSQRAAAPIVARGEPVVADLVPALAPVAQDARPAPPESAATEPPIASAEPVPPVAPPPPIAEVAAEAPIEPEAPAADCLICDAPAEPAVAESPLAIEEPAPQAPPPSPHVRPDARRYTVADLSRLLRVGPQPIRWKLKELVADGLVVMNDGACVATGDEPSVLRMNPAAELRDRVLNLLRTRGQASGAEGAQRQAPAPPAPAAAPCCPEGHEEIPPPAVPAPPAPSAMVTRLPITARTIARALQSWPAVVNSELEALRTDGLAEKRGEEWAAAGTWHAGEVLVGMTDAFPLRDRVLHYLRAYAPAPAKAPPPSVAQSRSDLVRERIAAVVERGGVAKTPRTASVSIPPEPPLPAAPIVIAPPEPAVAPQDAAPASVPDRDAVPTAARLVRDATPPPPRTDVGLPRTKVDIVRDEIRPGTVIGRPIAF